MSPSPELYAMQDRIKAIIRQESEGYFDDPPQSDDLQVCARIASEFYVFLQQSDGTSEPSEADYMAGTIRSGLDWFFSMAQTGDTLSALELRRGFGQELPSNSSELKTSYDSIFHQLLECTHSVKAIGLLLSLIRMMLLFMTAYVPSFLSFSVENSSRRSGATFPITPPFTRHVAC